MGATRSQFKALADDKVLTPRIAISTIKAPWRPSDGTALLQELSALSVEERSADKRWEGIQQAKVRSGVSVGSIISAIRDGQLQVGQRAEVFGYASFEVLMAEIDKITPLKHKPADSSYISAAAFSREVGMRETGWFEKLFTAGHSSATRRPHSTLGGERIYLSEQDIEAFHQRFLTSTTMVLEFAEARQTIIAKLSAAGVKPFGPNGEAYGALYLRKDVAVSLI